MKFSAHLRLPIAIGLTMLVTSCSQPQNQTEAPKNEHSKQASNTASQPTSGSSTLKVAITGNTPPFAFMDEKGKPQGIDIDIIKQIGELEGFDVTFQTQSWNGMFQQVETGKSDLAVSGISYSDERNQKYALSQSYFYNPTSAVYTPKNNIQSVNDLVGLKIAAVDGGKSLKIAQSAKNATVLQETTPYLLLQKIARKEADVAIYDQPVWTYMVKNHPEYQLKVTPLESANEPSTQTVILMKQGNTELQSKINDGLTKLKQQGKLTDIEKKWMGSTEGTTTATASVTGKVS
ncbi:MULTISPECIES: substrate-binding periplasmic protein [unclassified Moraxella]|uniref:substrate-binding periplasmic protein n=1 Tax=unclassified Moraxella TaxID=2685852 RepID=UPI003AF5B66A